MRACALAEFGEIRIFERGDAEAADFAERAEPGLERAEPGLERAEPVLELAELALERAEPGLELAELALERAEPGLDFPDFAELTTLYAPANPAGLLGESPRTCVARFLARILFPLALAIRFARVFLLNSFLTP
jgi:hypothetical protein